MPTQFFARVSNRDLSNPRDVPRVGTYVRFDLQQRVTTGAITVTNVSIVPAAEALASPYGVPEPSTATSGKGGVDASAGGVDQTELIGRLGRGFVSITRHTDGFINCVTLNLPRLYVHASEVWTCAAARLGV